MKKMLSYLLALVMLIAVISTGTTLFAEEAKGDKTTAVEELNIPSAAQVDTYDYLLTAKTSDHEVLTHLIDGLLENDSYGGIKPCVAESYEHNADYTKWTFHIRKGVKWMTSDKEEFAELKAEDFVTGLRHGAEHQSETAYLLRGVIKGYSAYVDGKKWSDEEFAKVGVKALDDYTLEYTMEKPCPFFDTMTLYSVLYPANKEFLESKGEGCKLGAPNKETCKFGAVAFDSILYNGEYFLTVNNKKSKIEWVKNDNYWDKDNVFLKKVTYVYDDGSDPYSVIKGFESGAYQSVSLRTSWADYDKYLQKYKKNAYYTMPNNTTFGLLFNFNRQTTELSATPDKATRENTHKAILNENFRKALRAAFDKVSYQAVSLPKDLAKEMVRNINNFPNAGMMSDGSNYFEEVQKVYNETTGEKRQLLDGNDAFYSPDDALAYIEKAKKDGIKFPVHLDIIGNGKSTVLVDRMKSFKHSVETNTKQQIIIDMKLVDQERIEAIVYRNSDPAKMDYDISTYTGWGPDYGDPMSFVDIFSTTTGYEMPSIGLRTVDDKGEVLDKEIKDQIGLSEYEKLYRAAADITTDMDKRYEAFAKADAKLIEKCIYIPTQMAARGQVVSKYVPFSGPYGDYGITNYKYKGIRIQKDPVTVEQHDKALKHFYEVRREMAASKNKPAAGDVKESKPEESKPDASKDDKDQKESKPEGSEKPGETTAAKSE